MPLLYSSGSANYVGVVNVASATAWYIDKLGLRNVNVPLDEGDGCVALGFSKDDYALCLGPRGRPTDELTPRLYSSNVKKSRELLFSRGVNVGEIQEDCQGTSFFEIRDFENNLIEISEEP